MPINPAGFYYYFAAEASDENIFGSYSHISARLYLLVIQLFYILSASDREYKHLSQWAKTAFFPKREHPLPFGFDAERQGMAFAL
jgi:hypothetical protein